MVHDVLNIYSNSGFILNTLFSLDILTQLSSAMLFFCAAWIFISKQKVSCYVNYAFGVSLGLWAAFILVDEILIAYGYEHNHQILLTFELVTFLSFYLLPDRIKE